MNRLIGMMAAMACAASAHAQKPDQAASGDRLAQEAARRSALELGCAPAQPMLDGRTEITPPTSGIGAALLHFTVAGCTRQNVLLMVAPGQPSRAMALLPGGTAADPTLQRDAIRPALALAVTRLGGCRAARITDTHVTVPGRVEQGHIVGGWTEEWIATGCGTTARIQVTLTPSARGGTDYSLRPVR